MIKIIRELLLIFVLGGLPSVPVFAEVYKCVADSGVMVFSDEPCDKNPDAGQQKLNINPSSISGVGFAKYATGLITGYTGTFRIKDSFAHLKQSDNKIYVDLWLYPFSLTQKEIKIVKTGGIIERGKEQPAKFNFSFASNLTKKISYKDVSFTGLTLANGQLITASSSQWYALAKSIELQYHPDEGKLSFQIKGKVGDYSIFINTKTYIYKKESSIATKEWSDDNNEHLFDRSVFGIVNFPYPVRPDLVTKAPVFTVKDTKLNKWVSYKNLKYDETARTYSISGLKPSSYRIHMTLENSTEFRGAPVIPGEMYAHKDFAIEDEKKPVRIDLDMIVMMHLTKPVNNKYIIPLNQQQTYASPLEFVWNPLAEGTLYKCIIKRVNKRGRHTSLDKHMEIDIQHANLTVNLTPGLYHFVLQAYKNGVKSGEMRIHDQRSIGFEYVFKVK
ncbi:MAG: DUF4124 domain-containing protein [Gammaproteobacteria bacterium]|nr:DUF4124 domain-containing protein [Gammaproteobacteria bacterium]